MYVSDVSLHTCSYVLVCALSSALRSTSGWYLDRIKTAPHALKPIRLITITTHTGASAASHRITAPRNTATIGSITVSPAMTSSGGPDA